MSMLLHQLNEARRPGPTIAPTPASAEVGPTRRVLVVVRWPVGGIRTHILYNYPTLKNLGYEFTFVAPDDETLQDFEDSLTTLGRVQCIGVPVKGKKCGLWRAVRRQLKTRHYDLVHSHGVTAAVHSSVANLGLRYPHVATLHDVFRPCHFAGLAGALKRHALAYLLKQVDALVPVSDDVRQNLFDYLPALTRRENSIITILNGIGPGAATNSASAECHDLRHRLRLHDDVRIIGFLGRFMEQKGFLPLLRAVRQIADRGAAVPFHLAALGSGDYRNEYTAAVRRLGIERHVTILDFTPDVRPVLAALNLLVIPSLWEASSLLAMEAMTAGVPVLGTDCIGLREVLRDTPARTVPAGDVGALAAAITAALETPWADEAEAYAPTARVRFDNAPSARKLAAVFADLIGERASRR
jgi:glycosyltransferase involved in cell wall biosynthesis